MNKNRRGLDTYDDLPSGMRAYLKHYGYHFNRKMYEFAVSTMEKKVKGTDKTEKMQPVTREKFEEVIKKYNITLKNDTMYDGAFVWSMAYGDFFGSSLPTEQTLAQYVADYVDDIDKPDGFIFNRFYADCCFAGIPIEWEDML